MKQIFYAGNSCQPCVAEYAVVIDDSESIQRAQIVVVQSSRKGVWTSLYNTDEGRDNILNRILALELPGVRVEFLSFTIILDLSTHMEGLRLPIRVDWDDYINKGNPYRSRLVPTFNIKSLWLQVINRRNREKSMWSGHVVGGCARFYTELMDPQRHALDVVEASKLLERVGYSRPSRRG